MDFEAMSAAEIAEAKREIRRLTLPLDLRRTRRLRPDPQGPVTDLRRTIRSSLRQGGEIVADRPQPPHHPPAAAGRAVRHIRLDGAAIRRFCCISCTRSPTTATASHVFLFGTRLSNVTRQLRSP